MHSSIATVAYIMCVCLQVRNFLRAKLSQQQGRKRPPSPCTLAGSEAPGSLCIIDKLHDMPTKVIDVKGKKPLHALQDLQEQIQDDEDKRAAWRTEARVAAIMGSCARSRDCVRSGISLSFKTGCAFANKFCWHSCRHKALDQVHCHHIWEPQGTA